MKSTINTIELLTKFVNQRPGLEYANYGEVKAYRSEMREITNDRSDYYELLSLAASRVENLGEKINTYLTKTSGRLSLTDKGELYYCAGQYFPVEYRPAACRVLVDLIWADYRDEKDNEGNPVYKDGNEMRKAIRRRLSRRVAKNYFN